MSTISKCALPLCYETLLWSNSCVHCYTTIWDLVVNQLLCALPHYNMRPCCEATLVCYGSAHCESLSWANSGVHHHSLQHLVSTSRHCICLIVGAKSNDHGWITAFMSRFWHVPLFIYLNVLACTCVSIHTCIKVGIENLRSPLLLQSQLHIRSETSVVLGINFKMQLSCIMCSTFSFWLERIHAQGIKFVKLLNLNHHLGHMPTKLKKCMQPCTNATFLHIWAMCAFPSI